MKTVNNMKILKSLAPTLLIVLSSMVGVQAQKFGFINTQALISEIPEVSK